MYPYAQNSTPNDERRQQNNAVILSVIDEKVESSIECGLSRPLPKQDTSSVDTESNS